MEFLLDTADLREIERGISTYPITGVTTNPTILSGIACKDVFDHMRQVRKLIGFERTLHMQVLSFKAQDMIKEAHMILEHVDNQVSVKVPVCEEGLKAIKTLKAEGIRVTATAIFSKIQGFMAIAAGADYIAPYCNKIASLDIDFVGTITAFYDAISKNSAETKILAAGFKSIGQVNEALCAGAHAVTVVPELLYDNLDTPPVKAAIEAFHTNWEKQYGPDWQKR